MAMNRTTTTTPRKPTQRAFDDWRTTWAARSGVSSTARTDGGDVKRSTGATSAGGRGTGNRSSGSRPGVSVTGPLAGRCGRRSSSDAAGRGPWRDQPRLTESDRQRAERDLAGIDREHARAVHADRETIHPPRRRAELGAVGLDPDAVITGAVTRTFEPEVLDTRVRLAPEMRASLVEGPHVEGGAVSRVVLAGDEPLLSRVIEDDERARFGVVGGEAFLDRQRGVLELDGVEVTDRDRGAETAFEVGPDEPDRAGGHLEQPEANAGPDRGPHQLAAGDALDLLLAQRLDGLLGQGGRLVDRFDVVVAHARWFLRDPVTGRSGGLA